MEGLKKKPEACRELNFFWSDDGGHSLSAPPLAISFLPSGWFHIPRQEPESGRAERAAIAGGAVPPTARPESPFSAVIHTLKADPHPALPAASRP